MFSVARSLSDVLRLLMAVALTIAPALCLGPGCCRVVQADQASVESRAVQSPTCCAALVGAPARLAKHCCLGSADEAQTSATVPGGARPCCCVAPSPFAAAILPSGSGIAFPEWVAPMPGGFQPLPQAQPQPLLGTSHRAGTVSLACCARLCRWLN